MKNFIQPGNTVSLIAPSGGVVSGNGYLIGALFVVALHSAAAGAAFEGVTEGCFTLAAEGAGSGQAIAQGALVYWDNTEKRCTATATNNTKIGCAITAKITTATAVDVRLNGTV